MKISNIQTITNLENVKGGTFCGSSWGSSCGYTAPKPTCNTGSTGGYPSGSYPPSTCAPKPVCAPPAPTYCAPKPVSCLPKITFSFGFCGW